MLKKYSQKEPIRRSGMPKEGRNGRPFTWVLVFLFFCGGLLYKSYDTSTASIVTKEREEANQSSSSELSTSVHGSYDKISVEDQALASKEMPPHSPRTQAEKNWPENLDELLQKGKKACPFQKVVAYYPYAKPKEKDVALGWILPILTAILCLFVWILLGYHWEDQERRQYSKEHPKGIFLTDTAIFFLNKAYSPYPISYATYDCVEIYIELSYVRIRMNGRRYTRLWPLAAVGTLAGNASLACRTLNVWSILTIRRILS